MKLRPFAAKDSSFARRLLPLSAKLTLALMALQLSAVGIGTTWLIHQLKAMRIKEVDSVLDSEADAIGDAIAYTDSGFSVKVQGELLGDLNRSRTTYFILLNNQGQTLFESKGPRPKNCAMLRAEAERVRNKTQEAFSVRVDESTWRLSRENIVRYTKSGQEKATLIVATNVSSALEELEHLARMMIAGALVLIAIISAGTGLIVSASTRNLRQFAHSLRSLIPETPSWSPPARPRSTEERAIFESFQKMIGAIRTVMEKQRLFVASASHELKTPVAAMLTALEVTLSRPRDNQQYLEVCRDLQHTVRGLRRLTTVLLDIARLEGLTPRQPSPVDVGQVLDDIQKRLEPAARQKSVEVSIVGEVTNQLVLSFPDLLEVALGNILDNAIKYSPCGGSIQIRVMAENSHIKLAFVDQGRGMSEAEQARLGELFYRADESRTDGLSYGLGFAQAQRIIEASGGLINVKSALGQGTTVTVALTSA